MSRLAEIDLERQDSLSEASCNHAEAYEDYMTLLDKYPPARRNPEEAREIEKSLWRLEYTNMRLEAAKRNRYAL